VKAFAIDPSFNGCGWALACDETGIQSGVIRFPIYADRNGEKSPALRFRDFRLWLDSVLETNRPDIVIYEENAVHGRGRERDALVGIKTRILEMCAIHCVPTRGVYPVSLKKWAIGNGRADKSEMKEMARRRFEHYDLNKDDGGDEADALMLLSLQLSGDNILSKPRAKKKKS